MWRSRTKLTGNTNGPRSSTTATRPRCACASSWKHSDLDSSCQRTWRPGLSPIAAAEMFAAACEQDAGGRPPHADRGLDDRPEPEHELRVAAVTQLGADEFAQPRKLERLAVQRCRNPACGAGQQYPLQRLPGIHPVHRAVIGGR